MSINIASSDFEGIVENNLDDCLDIREMIGVKALDPLKIMNALLSERLLFILFTDDVEDIFSVPCFLLLLALHSAFLLSLFVFFRVLRNPARNFIHTNLPTSTTHHGATHSITTYRATRPSQRACHPFTNDRNIQ